MIEVHAYRNESIDSLLKRFKKACDDDGILQEVKQRSRYTKPSELKRLRKMEKDKLMAKVRRKEREALRKEMQ